MKNSSCSAATVDGGTALPFVISTAYPDFLLRDASNDHPSPAEEGSLHRRSNGLGPTKGDEKHPVFSNYSPVEAPPSPLSSRPKRSAVERSLCGCSFLGMFFDRLPRRGFCLRPCYSSRRSNKGSAPSARNAGTNVASSPSRIMTPTTPARTSGSPDAP
jgi:hypothetical protein